MALVKCKECGSEISSKAETCPRCGVKIVRTSGCAWLFLVGSVLTVLMLIVTSSLSPGPSSYPAVPRPQSTPRPVAPPKELSPADREAIRARAPQAADEAGASEVIVAAKRAVRNRLKDPDSAQFRDVQYGNSTKTGPAAFGRVNSKNALGGYTGFQRFVSNGATVLLEEEDEEGTLAAWRSLLAKEMTSWAPTALSDPAIKVAVDVTALVGKSQSEIAKLLGKPTGVVKDKNGPGFEYQGGKVEIIFISGRADWITINGLAGVPFTPAAVAAVGLSAKTPPTFGNEYGIRWEPFGTYPYVGIAPGKPGTADWIYVKAVTK